MEPTKEMLNELLTYKDGCLYWKEKPVRGYKISRPIGSMDRNGYIRASFKDRRFMLHRLVWIFHNGEINEGMQINHKDCDRGNNSIDNLELVTPRENLLRTKHHKTGRLFGCYFHKKNKKWRASINIDGKLLLIGEFSSEEDAHNAYKNKLASIVDKASNTP